MKFKKILSVALATTLFAGLAGCGSKSSGSNKNLIKWYLFENESNTNCKEVYAQASKLIKERTGAEVQFIGVQTGDYEAKMQTLNAAGEQVDIMFVSNWCNNYYQKVANGTLIALDDLLPKVAPDLYKSLPDYMWEGSKVDGKIYAIPNQQIVARQPRFAIPAQNADLLGINPDEYFNKDQDFKGSMADMETYLDLLHSKTNTRAKLSKMWIEGISFFDMEEVLGSYLPGAIRYSDCKDGNITLFNQYESDEFKYYINKRREWVQKEYVQNEVEDKRSLPGIDDPSVPIPELLKVSTYKPGVEAELEQEHKYKPTWLVKSVPVLTSGGIVATMNGITASCQNPELALKVLQCVNTDKEVYNTLAFGIEGVNYKKVGDNRIEKLESCPFIQTEWSIGNVFNGYVYGDQEDDIWAQTKEINDTAERSPLLGFNPNLDSLKTETANCASAVDEFLESLDYGIVDVDTAYPQFIEKLRAAGSDKIIAEVQKQIDEWLKNNK